MMTTARQRLNAAYREGTSTAGLRTATPTPTKPLVWLDCDGPLANILEPTLALINELTGRKLTVQDVTDWDLFACLELDDSTEKAVRALWQAPGFCNSLLPAAGAKTAVAELLTFCDVRVATTLQSSAPTWAYDRLRWLAREFKIPATSVVFTTDKSVLIGDVFVDDKIEHVQAAEMPAFLFDMPYNRRVPRGASIERVENWAAFVKKVRGIARSMQAKEAV